MDDNYETANCASLNLRHSIPQKNSTECVGVFLGITSFEHGGRALRYGYRIISERLDQYAKAVTSLYGVIDLTELVDLINTYEHMEGENRLTILQLRERLFLQLLYDGYYLDTPNHLSSYAFLDRLGYISDGTIWNLCEVRSGKERFTPKDAEAFLQYADPRYYTSMPQIRTLRKKLIAYGANTLIAE